MQWLLQDSGITFDFLDNNVKPLRAVLEARGSRIHSVGFDPDRGIVTGLEPIERGAPAFFYGSTTAVETAADAGLTPGVYFRAEWFDPAHLAGRRSDLLNREMRRMTVAELRRDWIEAPAFVKSVGNKVLPGMVIEGPDRADWIKEHAALEDEVRIVISPVQAIEQEWRYFLVGGEIVAGSQYRHDGVLRIREPIRPAVWDQARRMAAGYLPCPTIVMDIARLRDGEYRLVEVNSVNSSGFYNADIGAFVDAIERLG